MNFLLFDLRGKLQVYRGPRRFKNLEFDIFRLWHRFFEALSRSFEMDMVTMYMLDGEIQQIFRGVAMG